VSKTENSAKPAPDALWEYALGVYRRPGVEAACLRLQDEAGLDVLMLLFCLWAAREHGRLGAQAMARALTALAPWSDGVIAPLRAARRRLKTDMPDQAELRRAIGDCERKAERQACVALGACLPPAGAPSVDWAEAAAANIADYLAAAGISPRPSIAADLESLVAAAA
jgi:uncharacterized protein (TIGR02444 family)